MKEDWINCYTFDKTEKQEINPKIIDGFLCTDTGNEFIFEKATFGCIGCVFYEEKNETISRWCSKIKCVSENQTIAELMVDSYIVKMNLYE